MRFSIRFAVLVLVGGVCGETFSQVVLPQRRGAGGEAQEDIESIFLPAPRTLRQHLTRAQTAIDQGRYGDAVSELGALLASPELTRSGARGDEPQDFFLGSAGGVGTQRSLKTEAQRLLGSLPARGRELYELQYGAEAKALLEEAVRSGDIEKLSEVGRRYFHTPAGYDATVLLGRLHLDRGRPLAAALCWIRVLENRASAARYDPDLSVSLATAYLRAERPEQAVSTLRDLRARMPQTRLRIGNQADQPLPESGQELAWLTRHFRAGAPLNARLHTHQWTMYRGDPTRNASTSGDRPLRAGRWHSPTASHPADGRLIAELGQGFLDEDVPAIPALQPLAVDNVVLMRTPERLLGLDFQTGKRVWEYPWWDLPSEARDGGAGDARSGSDTRKVQLAQRLWYDAAYGQLSSDGESVFLLDELGYTVTGNTRFLGGPLGPRAMGDAPASHNQLVALDLKREGAYRWMVGGETGLDEPKLASAFFLGAPLPLFGQLYVLAEIHSEIRLVVLDAQTGRQEWSQQLAHVDAQTILNDPQRRLSGASPSFSDGIVVCPTSAGAVVAVDMATRSLLWGYQYAPLVTMNRNFGIMQPYPGQVLRPGNRWLEGTATVAGGAVLLTPPESSKLICLDLLTGEPKWPARERVEELGDMLYVACVHDGAVVLVGRTQVQALRLSDGKPAWPQPVRLAQDVREMPSGRGYYSEHFYYLPTTASRLLKIDLEAGKIVERTRTDRVLGNVICFRDHVIGQGLDGLSVYYQMTPLQQQVTERLAKSPDDAWALARRGELLLNEGQVRDALVSLRSAYELTPNDQEVRNLLVNTFLIALQEDFPRHLDLAPQIEPLIDDPLRRIGYLRVLSAGLLAQGRLPEAWDASLAVADLLTREQPHLPSLWEAPAAVDSNWSSRWDRWFEARFAELWAVADESLKRTMEDVVRARREAALQGSVGDLRQFLALFGPHPLADSVRLKLADELIKANEWLAAEWELGQLLSRTEPAEVAGATARLAQLAVLSGRPAAAVSYYRELKERWGELPCHEGQTGAQLFSAASAHPALTAAFDADRPWRAGRVKTEESPQGVNRQAYRRTIPVPLHAQSGPAVPVSAVVFDAGIGAALARDPEGRSLFRVKFNTGMTFYSQQPGLTQATALGSLLMLAVADQVATVDTLKAPASEDEAVLWRESLTQSIPDLSPQPARSLARYVTNPLDPAAPPKNYLADAGDRPLGRLGPLTHRGVYYQKVRTLICSDPLTGRTNWSRSDIPQGAEIFGDDQFVYAVGPDSNQGVVLGALDGHLLRRLQVPDFQHRWTVWKNRVLTCKQDAAGIHLVLHDAQSSTNVWSETFPPGSRGTLVGNQDVAVLQPDGRLLVRSLAHARPLVEYKLAAEPQLHALLVVPSREQFVICTTRDESERVAVNSGVPVERIQGRVYAFDRRTGQPQWPAPAYLDGYSLPFWQPPDAPALWFLKQYSSRTLQAVPGADLKAAVLCLDRRTGRVLFAKDDLPSQVNAHEIESSRESQTCSLSVSGYSATLTFTEEPIPPEEAARTTTSPAEKRASQLREFANSVLDALSSGNPSASPFADDPSHSPSDQRTPPAAAKIDPASTPASERPAEPEKNR